MSECRVSLRKCSSVSINRYVGKRLMFKRKRRWKTVRNAQVWFRRWRRVRFFKKRPYLRYKRKYRKLLIRGGRIWWRSIKGWKTIRPRLRGQRGKFNRRRTRRMIRRRRRRRRRLIRRRRRKIRRRRRRRLRCVIRIKWRRRWRPVYRRGKLLSFVYKRRPVIVR